MVGLRKRYQIPLAFFVRCWFWSFCARDGFVCPFRWFAFGVGLGRSACAVVLFVRMVVPHLALVLIVLCAVVSVHPFNFGETVSGEIVLERLNGPKA